MTTFDNAYGTERLCAVAMKKIDPLSRALKFYCIYVDRPHAPGREIFLTRYWGRIGRHPHQAVMNFSDELQAVQAFHDLRERKLNRGYQLVPDSDAIPGLHSDQDCALCRVVADIDLNEYDHGRLIGRRRRTVVLLSYDQRYRGRCMVIFRDHVPDFLGLDGASYLEFVSDIRTASFAVQRALRPDALNYAILGNVVSHLHCHILPRRERDSDWGRAPTLDTAATMAPSLTLREYSDIAAAIRHHLPDDDAENSQQLTLF